MNFFIKLRGIASPFQIRNDSWRKYFVSKLLCLKISFLIKLRFICKAFSELCLLPIVSLWRQKGASPISCIIAPQHTVCCLIGIFVSEPTKGQNCLFKGSIQCSDLFLKGLLSDTTKKGLNTLKYLGLGKKIL